MEAAICFIKLRHITTEDELHFAVNDKTLSKLHKLGFPLLIKTSQEY